METSGNGEDKSSEFAQLSSEYAEAVQALETIRTQGDNLVLMGRQKELSGFLDQFIVMATNAAVSAQEKGEANFQQWFTELAERARSVRDELLPDGE